VEVFVFIDVSMSVTAKHVFIPYQLLITDEQLVCDENELPAHD
jgi:hypothetical protein